MDSLLVTLAMMGGQPAEGGGNPVQMFVPMIIIFAIFYFMLIRPQQRKEKERRGMIEQVKSGDRVMFSGGILGNVTNTKDNTVIVKIADGVKVEVARGGIQRVLDKDEKVTLEDDK